MRFVWIYCLALLGIVSTPATADSGTGPTPVCQEVAIATASGTVRGTYCLPVNRRSSVLLIVVHGATYSRAYWDFPGFDGRYSYTRYKNRAGYATLAIDQIGVGRSTHPLSALVTFEAQAYSLHQVISASRLGALGQTFDKVVLLGHSIGSLVSLVEAARYRDVDGLVLTGFSHSLGATGFSQLLSKTRPALLDPLTRDRIPFGDLGYLSVVGGRSVFYASGDAEPALVEADELLRHELPSGMLTLPEYLLAESNAITAPVLVANGRLDIAFCSQGNGGSLTDCDDAAALRRSEQPFFQSSSAFETWVLPDAGHNINLIRQADVWYARALAWMLEHFPR